MKPEHIQVDYSNPDWSGLAGLTIAMVYELAHQSDKPIRISRERLEWIETMMREGLAILSIGLDPVTKDIFFLANDLTEQKGEIN